MRADYDAVDEQAHYTQQLDMQNLWQVSDPVMSPEGWDLDQELAQMLGATQTPDPVPPRQDKDRQPLPRPVHRKRPQPGAHTLTRNPRFLTVSVLVTLITLCAVTMLTWSISYSYDQLRSIALLVVSPKLAHWWPLTVYGPWLLAGLSILRVRRPRCPRSPAGGPRPLHPTLQVSVRCS